MAHTQETSAGRDELTWTLRASGYRVTRQRRAVWEVLQDVHGHLTADEITRRAMRDERPVDVASVYRTLSLLTDLGLVRVSRLGDGEASRWEIAHPDEHFHVVCESCGVVDHHVGSLVATIREHLADGHDFAADTVELVVTGRCAACRA